MAVTNGWRHWLAITGSSVGRKIVLLSLAVGAVFAAVGAVGLVQSSRLTAQLDVQHRRDVVALAHMTSVGEALADQHAAVLAHVLSEPGFYRDSYSDAIVTTDQTIDRELSEVNDLDLTTHQRNQLRAIQSLLPAWRAARDDALDASRAGDRAKATSLMLVRSQAIRLALETRVNEVMQDLVHTIDVGTDRAKANSQTATALMIGGLIGATVAAVTLSILVSRTIVAPLRTAVTVLGKISHGDFSERLRVRTNDEVGRLAASLNRTADVLEESMSTMRYQATHDGLTGLINRRHFHDRVTTELTRDGPGAAVLLIDLNGFKAINDAYGHAAGDAMLAEIGLRLQTNLRHGDLAARLGGDEFAVLLGSTDGRAEADAIAERLLTAIRTPLALDGVTVHPDASIGVAHWHDRQGVEELLHEADTRMYAAKSAARDPRRWSDAGHGSPN